MTDDLIRRKDALNFEITVEGPREAEEAILRTSQGIMDYIKRIPSAGEDPDFKSIGEAIGKALANNDILEVVRCEYCKHWNESDCHSTAVPIVRKCMCMNVYTDPDFFCKYGERRDDG